MELTLLCGEKEYGLNLPDEQVKGVLESKPLPVVEDEEGLVREALAHPVDAAPLGELVQKGETACIIVGDMTRLWARHHVLLPPLLGELNRGGIPDDKIVIVSATGDHREQTPEEHRLLVGEETYSRVTVVDHRARVAEEMIYLGTTVYGTPVSINRRVVDADRVILTGGIVYHFLAGWGGGKKSLVPGVAAYETIMKNHSLAFHAERGRGLNPAVCAGSIESNPCSDDMVQGAGMVGPDFLVNTVINEGNHKIARVVAGNYLTAYNKGCDYVNYHFRVEIDSLAELVIVSCGGYPKDINFYQTYKTIYNAHFALQKGGTMILLSESREGQGNDEFAAIFEDYPDNTKREAALRHKYTIGGHMGYHVAVLAEENDLLVLSSLPEATVRAMGMIPIKTLDEGMDFVRKKHGGVPPAYVISHGGTTFPVLKD